MPSINAPQRTGQLIVEAATVVVFRQGNRSAPEVLMVQRARELSFAGSAVVFPGGKLHASDHSIAAEYASGFADGAARVAAIREMIEETGLVIGVREELTANDAAEARAMLHSVEDLAPVLKRFGWTLDLGALIAFAHWVPTFKPGRIFDTRFYLANLGSGEVDLTPDLGENTRLFWVTAANALSAIDAGKIKAIYPTRRNLERLAQFDSFAAAAEQAGRLPLSTVSPWITREGDTDMLRIAEGIGYPVTVAPLSEISLD